MTRTLSTGLKCGALLSLILAVAQGGSITLDFEGFPDSTLLISQYAGVTFANTIILTSGVSLNEFEFPPTSGTNVASDNNGPITVDFASPVTSFSGYFTYIEPLTVAGFDAADNEVVTASSLYSSNDALFGDPGSSPNEFIHVNFAAGLSSVTITGDPMGTSFITDDLSYTTLVGVPEPAPFVLLTVPLAGILLVPRRLWTVKISPLSKIMTTHKALWAFSVTALLATSVLLYSHLHSLRASSSQMPFGAVSDPKFGIVIPSHLLITFKTTASPTDISSTIAILHGTVISTSPALRTWQIDLPWSTTDADLNQALDLLSSSSAIDSVAPDTVTTIPALGG